MNIRPILGKIIIKPQDAEVKTSGGLIIANAKNDGIIQGEVLAVGPGEYDKKGKFIEPEVQTGDIIILHTMAGETIEYEDEKYQVIANHEIVAVIS